MEEFWFSVGNVPLVLLALVGSLLSGMRLSKTEWGFVIAVYVLCVPLSLYLVFANFKPILYYLGI